MQLNIGQNFTNYFSNISRKMISHSTPRSEGIFSLKAFSLNFICTFHCHHACCQFHSSVSHVTNLSIPSNKDIYRTSLCQLFSDLYIIYLSSKYSTPNMKSRLLIFWDYPSRSLVEAQQRLVGTYCLHLQGSRVSRAIEQ
jgi:hypothetical protein